MLKIPKNIYVILLLLMNIQGVGQDVIINEIMSSNDTGIIDFTGKFSDWIEIYNTTDDEINLINYGLSDDVSDNKKWVFPEIIIQPFGFVIVYASGSDTITETEIHTNFSIKETGETIVLTNESGDILSLIEPVSIPTDRSFACLFDGSEFMTISNLATPNSSNNNFAGIYSSHKSGFYDDDFYLELISSDPSVSIRYTLNGETPSTTSILYTDPIRIKNNQSDDIHISLIPTTPLEGSYILNSFIWKEPQEVYRCNSIRYATFKDGEMQGDVRTQNFFVDNQIKFKYSFPIVTIVTDSFNLFDYETGIYIPGKRFDNEGFDFWPKGNYLNRGAEWERDIHITYFEPNGAMAFETDAGMRMRGFSSTSNPQKSFNTYFRSEYGLSGVEYPVFKNSTTKKYKRLIFRNSGNDFIHSHFKDALLQKIISPLELDLQAFQPSVVFLNGEYWGIHNIREKYDEYYFEYKFGIDNGVVNLLGVCGDVEEGTNTDYIDLISFIDDNDLSILNNYEYVISKIDIDNFIDFQIAEIFLANYDWPCNNFKIWKDNSIESKWRFLIYDLDLSFGADKFSLYTTNSMEHAIETGDGWPNCPCSNMIFRNLLKSEVFKKNFLDRFVFCLENIFESKHVINIIDEFEELYLPEINEHIARWGYPNSIDAWMNEINKLRDFVTYRPCYMSENIISYFELEDYDFTCFKSNSIVEPLLILFPNPTNGNFTIMNNAETDIVDGEVVMINSIGQEVYLENNISIEMQRRLDFNLSYLEDGVYFFTFKSEKITETKKIVLTSNSNN